jgi:hypothetical protein
MSRRFTRNQHGGEKFARGREKQVRKCNVLWNVSSSISSSASENRLKSTAIKVILGALSYTSKEFTWYRYALRSAV